jgi:carbon-monoxide dehydrogenase iron sulfur subunit
MSFLTDENNPEVAIDQSQCTGCRNCQLVCSFTNFDRFNPSQAYIEIDPGGDPEIRFSPDCLCCLTCVDYCVYGALNYQGEEG